MLLTFWYLRQLPLFPCCKGVTLVLQCCQRESASWWIYRAGCQWWLLIYCVSLRVCFREVLDPQNICVDPSRPQSWEWRVSLCFFSPSDLLVLLSLLSMAHLLSFLVLCLPMASSPDISVVSTSGSRRAGCGKALFEDLTSVYQKLKMLHSLQWPHPPAPLAFLKGNHLRRKGGWFNKMVGSQ